ncbi:hypothetical protein [Novosphingobium naphthalenivorans]|uniref:hypothetical protein n=1 Tax=Novosphingobium naphthalenivorans TaxID=273168 RepID=UPI0012EE5C1E|nr:hypothetical protein [Novosphingobium naphthalenivorans]
MSKNRRNSPYVKACLFMLCSILCGIVAISLVPMVLADLGLSPDAAGWVEASLGATWVLVGGIGAFAIRCPMCGRSLFKRRWSIHVPWPAERCSKCNYDLTNET